MKARFEAVFLLCIFHFVSSLWWPVQVQQLSKMEVEDLLRKGAYGALMDEEDEGSKFCEEDIDQILQRRTHTITIQSEGKGSTFAKVWHHFSRVRVGAGAERKLFFDLHCPGFVFLSMQTVEIVYTLVLCETKSAGSWGDSA